MSGTVFNTNNPSVSLFRVLEEFHVENDLEAIYETPINKRAVICVNNQNKAVTLLSPENIKGEWRRVSLGEIFMALRNVSTDYEYDTVVRAFAALKGRYSDPKAEDVAKIDNAIARFTKVFQARKQKQAEIELAQQKQAEIEEKELKEMAENPHAVVQDLVIEIGHFLKEAIPVALQDRKLTGRALIYITAMHAGFQEVLAKLLNEGAPLEAWRRFHHEVGELLKEAQEGTINALEISGSIHIANRLKEVDEAFKQFENYLKRLKESEHFNANCLIYRIQFNMMMKKTALARLLESNSSEIFQCSKELFELYTKIRDASSICERAIPIFFDPTATERQIELTQRLLDGKANSREFDEQIGNNN